MRRRCCCGCDIAWEDNFSTDKLADYSKTGTWSRTSNMLVGTSGSRIIGPGDNVTFFRVDMPGMFSTGTLGTSDEIKLIIRWVDSSNYIYGRVKNNGGGGADSQMEIWKVVSGTATQLMAQDYFATTSALPSGAGLTITDRAGVVSFGWGSTYNGLYSTSQYGGVGYNYSTGGSFSDEQTISCYVAGSPAQCGVEIVSSAADLRFDNWDSRYGTKNIPYGVATDCKRLNSRRNMAWQIPEVFTFDEMTINGLPGGWNSTIKSYTEQAEYLADGCDPPGFFAYKDPCSWNNPAITTTSEKSVALRIINAPSSQYTFELTTFSAAGGYQWYLCDDTFPIDPTAGDLTFTRNDGTLGYGSWSGSNPLPMPGTLTLTIVN